MASPSPSGTRDASIWRKEVPGICVMEVSFRGSTSRR